MQNSLLFFLGDISHQEKYELLKTRIFFLFPNHSAGNNDFEGFGISCIEASFFGNVIIAGNHGGVKEAVLDGETGFLFDFDDPASISQAVITIKTCIENPEQMEKINNGVSNMSRQNMIGTNSLIILFNQSRHFLQHKTL